jgi:hypothetical protein
MITTQILTVTAGWTQRYNVAGTRLPQAGVSQGVLDRTEIGDPIAAADGGQGHERSLVDFDVSALPDDADVAIVWLKVPWSDWLYANGVGNVVLGWHDHETAPEVWSVGGGEGTLAAYECRQDEPLDVVLQWANAAVGSGRFRGLAVGPGFNDGLLYSGSTNVAASEWVLTIHYLTSDEG